MSVALKSLALLVACLAAPITASLAAAQDTNRAAVPAAAALATKIDSIVQVDVLAQGMPSVSIVVSRGNETLVDRAWGLAEVASGRTAEPSTTYQVGSLSKQFTAALVLKLVDRGKLSLSDTLRRFFGGLRPEFNGITVEQLLNHTSGLKGDFRGSPERATLPTTRDSLVAMAARDTLATKPGTKFTYSNTGYMFAGAIIEKLYGKSYADALRDEIARPLGLESLAFCTTDKSGGAESYVRSADAKPRLISSLHPSQLLGNGGVCTTAGDLAKWNRALHGGRVVSDASYHAMTTPRGAAAINGAYYGLGLYVRSEPWGKKVILHGGTTAGYAAANSWYPDDSISVIVLYNGVPQVPVNVAAVVGQLAHGLTPAPRRPVAQTPVAQPTVTVENTPNAAAPAGAAKFVGEYEGAAGVVFTVTLENGILFNTPPARLGTPKQYLVHRSGTTFSPGGNESVTLTFVIDANGDVTGLVARSSGTERTLRRIK
jgi:D-alanyl-D-alanine carboxypeptidase